MQSNYEILIQKLDEFIRKYYRNQLIKGVLFCLATIPSFYLGAALAEYFFEFNSAVRQSIFYVFILTNLAIFGKFLAIPFLKLNKLGKTINHYQASQIIGTHFVSIQDKLLNVLQLKEQSVSQKSDLLLAAIDQKIVELKPIPFTKAIDTEKNKKRLRYALIPVLLFLVLLIAAPSLIKDPTERLINYNTQFEKKAPFEFIIENEELKTIQQKDFELKVKLTGSEVPDNVYIQFGEQQYKLNKDGRINHSYLFKNIQSSTVFYLFANGFKSKQFELKALPNPLLLGFTVNLQYPAYIGKKAETLDNTGDLIIPEGTKVTWNFVSKNTRLVRFNFNDTAFDATQQAENKYSFTSKFFASKKYSLQTANEFIKSSDSLTFAINVIPDAYPSILIEEKADSLSSKRFYFKGSTKDDYGFSKIEFKYKYSNDSIAESKYNSFTKTIAVNKNSTQETFFYTWDLSEVGINPGDKIEYYFEVWDNDGVHGAKSAKSQIKTYQVPTLKQLAENTEKSNSEIKEDLEESIKEAKNLQKEMNDLNKKMLEKKNLSWEEKKKMQELIDKQKNLQKKVENIQKQNQQNNTKQNELKPAEEKLLEKQQQLEDLFNKVMTPELKKLFEEMQKLLDNMDKNKTQEVLDKMKLETKDLEKELDRNLELFKKLELEQKMKSTKEQLEELAKKQEDLAKQAEQKNADAKELEKKQDELNKEFEDVKKNLEDIEKKNEALEEPEKLPDTEEQKKEIDKEQKNSSDQLKQNSPKKAAPSQKSAAQKMQKMAEQMQSAMESSEQEQQGEDMALIREILENLVKLSFEQEELINTLAKTDRNNPQYIKIAQQQKKLKDDAKMIEDSLFALSKRQPQIESFVNKEIAQVNSNMQKVIENLAERQTPMAANRQQLVMTSVNNLALILSESLQQMQQQMQQQKPNGKPGSGSCKNPGGQGKGKGKSMAQMKAMQQQLNEQIKKLKEQMEKEKGNSPGKGKDGKEGKDGKSGMAGQGGTSSQLAKLAAQQEALRRELQKAAEQLNKDGKQGNGQLQKLADQMEKTETDLVNKMITQETLKRQEEILTRLLEAEKAEREREMDEKRESNEAKNQENSNQNPFLEYNRLKSKEAELLKTVSPEFTKFYKNKVNQYFNTISN
ncbi:MAG: DUF4175 family protein [Bacteroidota bacterium]